VTDYFFHGSAMSNTPSNTPSSAPHDWQSNPYASPPPQSINGMRLEMSGQPCADELILPTGDQRLWTVSPIKQISIGELWCLKSNVLQFPLIILCFKILRLPSRPTWAAAFLDQREISEADIPSGWAWQFANVRSEAEAMGFVDPHYITSPTIGSRMSVEMIMTTTDGQIQFTFNRVIIRNGNVTTDETRLGFYSRLVGDRCLVTRKKMPEVRSCDWQIVNSMRTSSLSKLLSRHRQKLLEHATRPINTNRLVEESMSEDARMLREVIQRGLLREVTADEVVAIEAANG
jgi:hypothetical protein